MKRHVPTIYLGAVLGLLAQFLFPANLNAENNVVEVREEGIGVDRLVRPNERLIAFDTLEEMNLALEGPELAKFAPQVVANSALFVLAVETPSSELAVRALSTLEGVVAEGPNSVAEVSGTQSSPPWGLDRIDQANLPLNGSYSYEWTGSGVNIVTIDTGLYSSHQEFSGRVGSVLYTLDRFTSGADCDGHGTHVAGTIAGSTYGVAKEATVNSIRVLDCYGYGYSSSAVTAINYLIDNKSSFLPAVVNMSIGFSANTVVDNAVENLVAAGFVVVAAAGNDGGSSCNQSPARVASAITVAATDRYDGTPSWTNYGTCNDIFAPGVDVVSAGISSWTSSTTMSGTSMAAPHVAGAAALILDETSNLTPSQVWSIMQNDSTTGAISICCGDPDLLLGIHRSGTSGPPGKPRSLTATAGDSTITVTWNNGAGGVPFNFEVITNPASGYCFTSNFTCEMTGLTNGTPYKIKVRAINNYGSSRWATISNVTPAPKCFGSRPTIVGTLGKDTLRGTSGNDVIVAFGGNDVILGRGGKDKICAGDGNDRIDGGPGDDRIDGGSGADTVDYKTSSTGVIVDLAQGTGVGDGSDSFKNIENIFGSSKDDELIGSDSKNTIKGRGGNDVILGRGGNDRLYGDEGGDTIAGRDGADYCNGGSGKDVKISCERATGFP